MQSRIPTESECFDLLSEVDLASAVVRHSILVKRFALELTDELNNKGLTINRPLIQAAALLHDIMKLSAEMDHAIEGAEFLRERGHHEVAKLVEKHALNNLGDPSLIPKTPEERLLMYADLRVSGGGIVSLDERFSYIRKRYKPKDEAKFQMCIDFAKQLEKEFTEKVSND